MPLFVVAMLDLLGTRILPALAVVDLGELSIFWRGDLGDLKKIVFTK